MIPEAAVEAATEYLRDRFFWDGPLLDEVARELLEAAAPHMLADSWAKAYAAGFQAAKDGKNYDAIGSNPYRSQP